MTKDLKSFFIGISILFLTSCNNPFVSEKTITLPDNIKNILSAEYVGEGVYALNTSKDILNPQYKLINSKGKLITKEIISNVFPNIFAKNPKDILKLHTSFSKEGSILIFTSEGNHKYQYKLINKNGDILNKNYDSFLYLGKGIYIVNKDFTYGYCNSVGEEIAKPTHMKDFNMSDPNFLPYKNENDKYGFIDSKGKTIVPFIFDDADTSVENSDLVPVCKNDKWGFIDKKGTLIVPYKFDKATIFKDGTSMVMLNNKCGVIDDKGNLIVPYKFDFITELKSGLYRVMLGDKIATVDNKGNYLVKPQPNTMDLLYLDDKNIIVSINNKCELADKDRNILTDTKYDEIEYYENDLFRVSKNKKYGFINRQGKVIIPTKFNNLLEFKDNTCIVNINNKYGVVDINGKYKIDLKYDEIRHISKNYFAVKLNNKWGISDINGKIVKPIEYDDIAPINSNIPCEYNVILKQNNKALFLKIKE